MARKALSRSGLVAPSSGRALGRPHIRAMEHVSARTRTAEFEWQEVPVPGQVDALLAFLFERPIVAEQSQLPRPKGRGLWEGPTSPG